MGAWKDQARWWAGRALTGAVDASLAVLPPSARHEAIRWMELHDAALELDFRWPSDYRASCLSGSFTVAPATSLVIPSTLQVPVDVGNVWGELRVHHCTDIDLDVVTALAFHRGRVLTASGHGWRSARDGAFLSGAGDRVSRDRSRIVLEGPVTPVIPVHNYGHFLLEVVPRILRVQQVQPAAVAVIAGEVPGYARDILEVLGIPWDTLPVEGVVHCDDVWLCDPTPTGWTHPDDVRLLRETLLARVPDASGSERIYVSRRGESRAMAGVEQLEAQMEAWGFTVVRPQDLSFRDQLAAYAGATDVVADFGSGMSNTIVMRIPGRLVDVMTSEWWTPHFRQLAATMGIEYVMVPVPASAQQPFGSAIDAIPLLEQHLTHTS